MKKRRKCSQYTFLHVGDIMKRGDEFYREIEDRWESLDSWAGQIIPLSWIRTPKDRTKYRRPIRPQRETNRPKWVAV